MASKYQKPIIAAGVILTVGAVSITCVYLPNYTDKSYKHALDNPPNTLRALPSTETNLMGKATNDIGTNGGGSRGSMWGNIEKVRTKEVKDEEKK
mmetsp:Transcript_4717/g.4873  ORF Transcript_4717/g.4873 Transcript_4717/m.4873 type:complete len:95 (-) Transcript_4717:485-769(-)|eukprot:CAMPEP_0119037688 /NCGR_PEP_ID=MMETSP1177-20130426/6191_1 /TAXON_ID=2985 /ORGANISM="Ochromonas sp, Strain CCMP1899" /LENGTH=94 /DNA_ID=CAMNT_0006999305 /DNA_START=120 /DNA_END=404 /DNA_ORIENTATION=-